MSLKLILKDAFDRGGILNNRYMITHEEVVVTEAK